jgi:hypothetical protein
MLNAKQDNAKRTKRKKQPDAILSKLHKMRKDISLRFSVFPHHLLSENDLIALKDIKPTTMDGLVDIIGKVKGEKYGAEIMKLLPDALVADPQPDKSKKKRNRKTVSESKEEEEEDNEDIPEVVVYDEDFMEPSLFSTPKKAKI